MDNQDRQPVTNVQYVQRMQVVQHGLDHDGVLIVPLQAEHIPALVRLQRLCFPTLADQELIDQAGYAAFRDVFPQGQFVALVRISGKSVPVGSTSTFRIDFDFRHTQHSFLDTVAKGLLTHDAPGKWLYGVDLNVHPRYRGLGIGSQLYHARQAVVRQFNLYGEVAGAMIPGYQLSADRLTIAQYVLRVHQAQLYDPTLSMQLRNGFRVRGILYNYLSDPRSHHAAALIVRENPYYYAEPFGRTVFGWADRGADELQ